MKVLTILFFVILVSKNAFAEWGSHTTNLNSDCVVISSATEDAPIDFYEAECKAFGGFSLFISGSDLRYGPHLFFQNTEIDLKSPYSFHDMAAEEVQWFYELDVTKEGVGKLEWKGLVYSLSKSSEDGETDVVEFYAVALKGKDSCVVAKSDSKESAVAAIKSKADCL